MPALKQYQIAGARHTGQDEHIKLIFWIPGNMTWLIAPVDKQYPDNWSHRIKAIREDFVMTSADNSAFGTDENNMLVLLLHIDDKIKLLFLLNIVARVMKADSQSARNSMEVMTMELKTAGFK